MNSGAASWRPDAMTLEEKRALLAAAYGHGQAITKLIVIGESDAALNAYVEKSPEIVQSSSEHGTRLTFAELVYWDITLDTDRVVRGYSQSGYHPLMECLGIDFSGAPYVEGD